MSSGVVGTTGVRVDGTPVVDIERTTPEAPDLQRLLARDGGPGVRGRGDGGVLARPRPAPRRRHRFARAVFTNLSQDHLDYHGTMEDVLRREGEAVHAGESPTARRLTSTTRGGAGSPATCPYARDVRAVRAGADVRADGRRDHGERHLVPRRRPRGPLAASRAVQRGELPGGARRGPVARHRRPDGGGGDRVDARRPGPGRARRGRTGVPGAGRLRAHAGRRRERAAGRATARDGPGDRRVRMRRRPRPRQASADGRGGDEPRRPRRSSRATTRAARTRSRSSPRSSRGARGRGRLRRRARPPRRDPRAPCARPSRATSS